LSQEILIMAKAAKASRSPQPKIGRPRKSAAAKPARAKKGATKTRKASTKAQPRAKKAA
jgi:hypothetical protein